MKATPSTGVAHIDAVLLLLVLLLLTCKHLLAHSGTQFPRLIPKIHNRVALKLLLSNICEGFSH